MMIISTIFFMIVISLVYLSPMILHLFKNSSAENSLFIDVIECRWTGCTEIYADFHDHGGLRAIPNFISWAQSVETMTFVINELEDISALTKMNNLEELDIRGSERIPESEIRALEEMGIRVQH